MPELNVEISETGLALLAWLKRRIPAAPDAYLKQLVKKGRVTRAGTPLSAETTLHGGEEIHLPATGRLLELLSAPVTKTVSLSTLYETREILVVDKPAGLAVHSSQGHEEYNLTAQVATLLAEAGQKFKVAPVHRLDLETSGPVLFGKGKDACGRLGQLFMRQEVEKTYLALVLGQTPGSGRLESTLTAKGKQKPAATEYQALCRNPQASLLVLQLLTGRQHQIRRQLAAVGHPLYGDKRYRGPCPQPLSRLFLHCWRLSFVDPYSGASVAVEAPLPDELRSFLPQLQLQVPANI